MNDREDASRRPRDDAHAHVTTHGPRLTADVTPRELKSAETEIEALAALAESNMEAGRKLDDLAREFRNAEIRFSDDVSLLVEAGIIKPNTTYLTGRGALTVAGSRPPYVAMLFPFVNPPAGVGG